MSEPSSESEHLMHGDEKCVMSPLRLPSFPVLCSLHSIPTHTLASWSVALEDWCYYHSQTQLTFKLLMIVVVDVCRLSPLPFPQVSSTLGPAVVVDLFCILLFPFSFCCLFFVYLCPSPLTCIHSVHLKIQ